MEETFYNLQQVATSLKVSRMGLREWLHLAGISPKKNAARPKERFITHSQLEHLAQLHGRILPPDVPTTSPEADRLATLESNYVTLLAQVEALQRRLEEMARIAPQEARHTASSSADTSEHLQPKIPAETRPGAFQRVNAAPKPRSGKGGFTTTWRAQEFLFLHGVPRKEFARLADIPREGREEALHFAQAQGYTLHPCDVPGCPCKDVLP